MDFDETFGLVVRTLNEVHGTDPALVTPDSRLAEDLSFGWQEVDNLMAELAGWSLFDQFPDETKIDYWSVYRGLDRHFLSPYRDRDEQSRLKYIGRSIPRESRSITLEPLTIADIVRIAHAKRYVCRTPPENLEEVVVSNVTAFANSRERNVKLDSRFREDLGYEWRQFTKVLAAVDQYLGGAFYSASKGRTWSKAFLYWQAMEFLAGTPPLRVGDLVATARDNLWVGPAEVDWTSAIPGLGENRALTDDEILHIIKWLLAEQGVKFLKITSRTPVGTFRAVVRFLQRIEKLLGGRFVFSDEIATELRSSSPGFPFRVADVIRIVQANRWAEPRRWWNLLS